MNIFDTYINQPLFYILYSIYNTIAFKDLGLAIIFLTILVRLILFPFFYKSAKNQTILQKIQPQLRAIQKKHKDDLTKQGLEMMEIYKKYKVNPFSSLFLILIQLPIFIGLFNLFSKQIYFFENHLAFGFFDLTKSNFYIVFLAALFQYFQIKLLLAINNKNKKSSFKENNDIPDVSKIMTYIGPLITLMVFINLPAAVSLYWFTFSLFSFIQQLIINKELKKEDVSLDKEKNDIKY